MKYLLELSYSHGNKAKMLLKGHLNIECHPQYDKLRSLDPFIAVKSRVNLVAWGESCVTWRRSLSLFYSHSITFP